MSFHDVRLPERFSEGSTFGPGFQGRMISLKSGANRVVQFWPNGRRSYNLERGIDSLNSLFELRDFYMAREGMANTFRLRDWSDEATNPSGTTYQPDDVAVTNVDEVLVSISATQYQLVKRYVSGPTTKIRNLTMIRAGTTKIAFSGVDQPTGWTVDLLSGVVTFVTAPVGVITGGCEFDVHARFSPEADEFFPMAIKAITTGSLPEIRVIEELSPAAYNHNIDRGGAYDHGTMNGADVQLNAAGAMLNVFSPAIAGLDVLLPDATELPDGQWYAIANDSGTQTLGIKSYTGATVVAALAIGARTEIWLATVGSGKVWYVV